ncbi:MAG: purine-nucleoside phosphorylase [Candidatus Aureabacteria bacterium]|nr:purine-nucleoside phosphorylase [Candidatus Auribacterota bacterium]
MKVKEPYMEKSVRVIRKMLGRVKPAFYVISGSGQKKVSEFFETLQTVPFSRLSGFSSPTVKGHSGKLSLCTFEKTHFLVQCGRNHLYEKGKMDDVIFPVKVAKKLGIPRILFLNSAGAVKKELQTGDVVIITDHINFMFQNPLFARSSIKIGNCFVSMRPSYESDFIRFLRKRKKGYFKFGVYAGVTGPSYETKAELDFLEKAGADVVGMSTVMEAIYARYLGLKISGASLVANARKSSTSHDEVIRTANRSLKKISEIIKLFVKFLNR